MIKTKDLTIESKVYFIGSDKSIKTVEIKSITRTCCPDLFDLIILDKVVSFKADSTKAVSYDTTLYLNKEEAEASLKPNWQSIVDLTSLERFFGTTYSCGISSNRTFALEAMKAINDGWKPDWINKYQPKFSIIVDLSKSSCFTISVSWEIKRLGDEFYFETKEKAIHFYKYFGRWLR